MALSPAWVETDASWTMAPRSGRARRLSHTRPRTEPFDCAPSRPAAANAASASSASARALPLERRARTREIGGPVGQVALQRLPELVPRQGKLLVARRRAR